MKGQENSVQSTLTRGYNRLPFGVSSAPAIWQQPMHETGETRGQVPKTQCPLDDIIVAGATKDEHLRIIEEVLAIIGWSGVKLVSTSSENINLLTSSKVVEHSVVQFHLACCRSN